MSNTKYVLKLFIMGYTPRSEQAIKNLRSICEAEFEGEYTLEVINILEHPQLAEDERIIATPTLIRVLPEPLRRVIGDLSNMENVLLGLDIVSLR